MEVYAGSEALQATIQKVQTTAGGSLVISGKNLLLKAINKNVNLSTVALPIPDSEPPISLTKNRAVISNASGKLAVSDTTSTELGYVHGVTDPIQTQIDSKQNTITGAATTVTSNNLTASRAVISNASGKLAVSSTTSTELGYVHGVTSAIQTQLDNKEPTISLTKNMAVVSNSNGKLATSSKVSASELEFLDGATSNIQTQINSKEPTISLTASRAVISNASGKLAVSSTTSTEIGYVHGVTSAIQTQIDSKQAIITGAATTVTSKDLTVNRVCISNANGKIAVSSITTTQLSYLSGATGNIQTQLNTLSENKQDAITGAASSVVSNNLAKSMALVSDSSGKIAASSTISATELGYLNNATSNIQTQLNQLKFVNGNTISGSCYIAGYLTNLSKQYRFTIPLVKPIIYSGTLTLRCDELKLAAIQNGNYLFGNDSTDYDAAGDGSATIAATYTNSGIRIVLTLGTSVGGTTNATVGLRVTSYKFTVVTS